MIYTWSSGPSIVITPPTSSMVMATLWVFSNFFISASETIKYGYWDHEYGTYTTTMVIATLWGFSNLFISASETFKYGYWDHKYGTYTTSTLYLCSYKLELRLLLYMVIGTYSYGLSYKQHNRLELSFYPLRPGFVPESSALQ